MTVTNTKGRMMNEDTMKKYDLVQLLLSISSEISCSQDDDDKPAKLVVDAISDKVHAIIVKALKDMGEL
jgi:hypothetical protein